MIEEAEEEVPNDRVSKILIAMDMEDNLENRSQVTVFVDTLSIFRERSKRHSGVWKDSGWRGALFDTRKKTDRLWNEFMVSDNPPEDLDSAYDAINFLAFFIRGKKANINGTWRWK